MAHAMRAVWNNLSASDDDDKPQTSQSTYAATSNEAKEYRRFPKNKNSSWQQRKTIEISKPHPRPKFSNNRPVNPWNTSRSSSRNRMQQRNPVTPEVVVQQASTYEFKTKQAGTNNQKRRLDADGNETEQKRPRFLGFKKLEELASKESNEILLNLLMPNSGLVEFFTSVSSEKRDVVALFIIVLSKACDSLHRQNVVSLVNTVTQNKNFMYCVLVPYLGSFESSHNQKNHLNSLFCLVEFLDFYQKLSPASATRMLPAMMPLLKSTCNSVFSGAELDEIVERIKEMEKQKDIFLKDHTKQDIIKTSVYEQLHFVQPPENYRQIPILPTVNDIQQHVPFLRPNIVEGKYSDVEHYLDVQFRLLREDYIKPLREGITTIKRLKNLGQPIARNRNIKVYNDIHIVKQEFFKGNLVFFAQFDSKLFHNVKWEYSKRFLTGSLLCLSSNNFDTMLFVTVAFRDCEQLQKGILVLHVENSSIQALNISPLESFTMLETDAYFEAYRHNLAALIEIDGDNFPFSKYIVNVENKVTPPRYLTASTTFDMSLIAKGLSNLPVTILENNSWPSYRNLGLDESQYNALKTAVTKEFAIIQGPPGTGKTYVGLKIVQLLLHNSAKLSKERPILIVCYTNHALDQFLEGIHSFTDRIVRIGGRCNSETISEYKLINLKKIVRSKREVPHHIFTSVSHQYLVLNDLNEAISQLNKELLKSTHTILEENLLKGIIADNHYTSLKSHALSSEECVIGIWLNMHTRDFSESQIPENNVIDLQGNNSVPINVTEQQVHQQRYAANTLIDGNNYQEEIQEVAEFDTEFVEGMRDVENEDFVGLKYNGVADNKDNSSGWEIKAPKSKQRTFVVKQLEESVAMTNADAEQITNVWEIKNVNSRWRLYKLWLQQFQQEKQRELLLVQEHIRQEFERLKEMRVEEDLFVMKQAQIIGMTTTGVSKYRNLVENIRPQIVVIEEAAEILEAHVITTLTEDTEHVILIGDHQQLKPNPTVYELAVKYNLNVSLFERLVKNGMNYCQLTKQHRMRPEIAALLVPHIYPNLENHKSVYDLENIKGVTKNVFFLSHNCLEDDLTDSTSRVNKHEADFIIELCKYLLLQGYDSSQITILTTYSGQLFTLRKRATLDLLKGVRITVVDNFQGEENDIILMSFVRSNEEGNVGFLKVSNRVCVALSRAKQGFYCIGNFDMLSESTQLWKDIQLTLEKQGSIGPVLTLQCQNHPDVLTPVAKEKDFEKVSEGGCLRPCEFRLLCGHTCTRICHSYDREHEKFNCNKPCQKIICNRGHKCPLRCYKECGLCKVPVLKTIPECGHTVTMECHIDENVFVCTHPCTKTLICGHKCKKTCGEICDHRQCKMEVNITLICGHSDKVLCYKSKAAAELIKYCASPCITQLQCGHMCSGTCGECSQQRLHKECKQPCTRILVCGHECKSNCSSHCPPCKRQCENRCIHSKCPRKCGEPCSRCNEKCAWKCEHLSCDKTCGELCSREPCYEPCKMKMPLCGHICPGLCGEPCPKKCSTCHPEVREIFFGTEEDEDAQFVELEDCGHVLEVEGLKQWMTHKDDEIQMKACPKCKTIIRRNLHFGNIVKTGLQNIEKVKAAVYGIDSENKSKLEALYKNFTLLDRRNENICMLLKPIMKYLESKRKKQGRKLSKMEIRRYENIFNIIQQLMNTNFKPNPFVDGYLLDQIPSFSKLITFSKTTKRIIFSFIEKKYNFATEQQLKEVTCELQRLKFILKTREFFEKHHSNPKVLVHFQTLVELLCKLGPFGEKEEEKFFKDFKDMASASGSAVLNVSQYEKKLILNAMNLPQGHWYQCPNGHVYCITECGGAMEQSRCNECGASIGGGNHTLLRDNRVARDMDGHSAWSDTANMGNYEFL